MGTSGRIISICTAYEQGYGHGLEDRNLTNPYASKTDEWVAWEHGFLEGYRKRLQHTEATACSGPVGL